MFSPDFRGKLDIYQKQIYCRSDDDKKIITQGIVVDGDISIKDAAFKFLYEHKWGSRFKDISFIPYSTNELFTKKEQIEFIKSNNRFQKSLARIIIKVNNASTPHIIGDKKISFQDWLYSSTIDKKKLILGVECIKDSSIRIFFLQKDLAQVKKAIHNLFQATVNTFGHHLASTMLDEDNLKKAKSSNDIELAHASKLKTLSSNPQGPDDADDDSKPADRNARCYFGTSFVDVIQGNSTQTSAITQDNETGDDLRSVVTKLTASYNELKHSIDASIQTAIDNVINNDIKPLKNQINEMKTTYDSKMETFLEKSDRQDEKLDKILGILGGNTQAPSEATRSPGVGK